MKTINVIVFLDGSPWGLHLVKSLLDLGVRPRSIIKENRKNNVIKRVKYRGKKYGWIATLIWAIDAYCSQKGDALHYNSFDFGGIEMIEVNSINDQKVVDALQKNPPRFILNTLSAMVKPQILNLPQLGVFGWHPGILPKYLGLSPIHWQVYDNNVPGFSIFKLTEGMDTGPSYLQKIVEPYKNEQFQKYCQRFHREAAREMAKFALSAYDENKLKPLVLPDHESRGRGLIPFKARLQVSKNWKMAARL